MSTTISAHPIFRYIILVAASLTFMAGYGFDYAVVGSFTIAQSRQLNISVTESTLAGATNLAFYHFATPAGAILIRLLSIRSVQFIGGGISVVGLSLSALSTRSWEMVLTFGVMLGFGGSLTRNTSIAIVQHHFNDELAMFALAAVNLGVFTAVALVPTLANYLFTHFGFQHAILLLLPFMAIHLIGGLTFTEKPPEERGIEYEQLLSHGAEKSRDAPTTPENGIRTSAIQVLTSYKVWLFAVSGCCRMFGLTAFSSLLLHYMVEQKGVSLHDAAFGQTVMGIAAVTGGILMCVFSLCKREQGVIIPHAMIHSVYGISVVLITVTNNKISYWALMAVFGGAYGIFAGMHLNVANKLGGCKDMLFVYALEKCLQGLASLTGGPIISWVQTSVSLTTGMYAIGGIFFAAAIIAVLLILPNDWESIRNKCKQIDCTKNSGRTEKAEEHTTIRLPNFPANAYNYTYVEQQNLESVPILQSKN